MVWHLAGMGGSERVVYEVVKGLSGSGFRISIVSRIDGEVRAMYEDLGVEVKVIPKKSPADLGYYLRLRAFFKEEAVQIVDAHHFGPYFDAFLGAFGTGTRIVYSEHTREELEALGPAGRFALRRLAPRADAVSTVSEQLRDYFVGDVGVDRRRVRCITNGIDLSRFDGGVAPAELSSFGIPPGAKTIVTIAHFRPQKNHQLLISAFQDVASCGPGVHLLLVGRDLMDGEIHRLAAESPAGDRIHIVGEREDIPSLLRAADVFCLPSEFEGLPLSVLEAMASGTVVVGADVLGINEVVEDGVNGLLSPAGDAGSLAERLNRILGDETLRRTLIERARLHVEERYTLPVMVRRHGALFEELAGV